MKSISQITPAFFKKINDRLEQKISEASPAVLFCEMLVLLCLSVSVPVHITSQCDNIFLAEGHDQKFNSTQHRTIRLLKVFETHI